MADFNICACRERSVGVRRPWRSIRLSRVRSSLVSGCSGRFVDPCFTPMAPPNSASRAGSITVCSAMLACSPPGERGANSRQYLWLAFSCFKDAGEHRVSRCCVARSPPEMILPPLEGTSPQESTSPPSIASTLLSPWDDDVPLCHATGWASAALPDCTTRGDATNGPLLVAMLGALSSHAPCANWQSGLHTPFF